MELNVDMLRDTLQTALIAGLVILLGVNSWLVVLLLRARSHLAKQTRDFHNEEKCAEEQVSQLLSHEQERVRRMEGLRTASANISEEIELHGLLSVIVRQAAALLDANGCELYLLDQDRREIFLAPVELWQTQECCSLPIDVILRERCLQYRRAMLVQIPGGAADNTSAPDRLANARSIIIAPLISRGGPIGVLSLIEINRPAPFDTQDVQIVELFAQQASIAIQNAGLFEEIHRLAITDSLTGLYNRRQVLRLARQELERVWRYPTPLSIILFDIDFFKQVNDRFGHQAGDQVLQWLAQRCQDELRSTDILGRYGGEEFLVILPNTNIHGGRQTAERLRASIAAQPFQDRDLNIPITISLGVAGWNPEMGSLETLVEAADRAMYCSKQAGRNRVTCETCPRSETLSSQI